jgi:hypothetical protein
MTSQRDKEGYLRIDHRDSPGFTEEEAIAAGRSCLIGQPRLFEAPTFTCSHCTRVVIMNPQRERSRAYCPKCDHLICDWCEAERVRTGVCRPFNQVIDEHLRKASVLITP